MSTGAIIAIVVAVLIIAAVVVFALPRLRAKRDERRLQGRRDEAAGRHREHADARQLRADAAEQHARRERAEAELHASRAEMHERGLADDELDRNGDMPPAREAPERGDDREGTSSEEGRPVR